MLSRKPYDEVAAQFHVDFDQRGITIYHADAWLTENGFAIARKLRFNFGVERSPWPPVPWSDVHLCEVRCSPGGMGHWCVMLADGSVLDPLRDDRARLTDYAEVSNVAAVYKVSGLSNC